MFIIMDQKIKKAFDLSYETDLQSLGPMFLRLVEALCDEAV